MLVSLNQLGSTWGNLCRSDATAKWTSKREFRCAILYRISIFYFVFQDALRKIIALWGWCVLFPSSDNAHITRRTPKCLPKFILMDNTCLMQKPPMWLLGYCHEKSQRKLLDSKQGGLVFFRSREIELICAWFQLRSLDYRIAAQLSFRVNWEQHARRIHFKCFIYSLTILRPPSLMLTS